jgi:hypothetical protein
MRHYIIIGILSIFIFSECKKDNNNPSSGGLPCHCPPACPNPPTPITDTNMLKCKFKAGTFWVFKDSLTNNIDTLLVESLSSYSNGVPGIPGSYCPVERLSMKTVFKNDTGNVLIHFTYVITNDGFILNNDFFWVAGAQPLPYAFNSFNVGTTYKTWDSLFVFDRYYKKVGESYAVQFTSTEYINNPTRMYCQSFKSYFNTEFGFLQFDLRDRLTGLLTGRRKIIARNIIR